MKPKRPLPLDPPFLTLVTHTYRRPQALARNMASVCRQTAVEAIEQIVLPDHLGLSPADAVYGRMPWYADAPRGRYVHVLGDDDVLADDNSVAHLQAFVMRRGCPPCVAVLARKGPDLFPKKPLLEAVEGDVDLCCFVMRRDVYSALARSYGCNYKCDWDGFQALKAICVTPIVESGLLFALGAQGSGRPEVDW